MDLEAQVREAIMQELRRQAEEGRVTVTGPTDGAVRVEGSVDLEALSLVVVASVAGGP